MVKGNVKEKVLRCVWFGKRKQRPTTEMGEGSFAGEILIEIKLPTCGSGVLIFLFTKQLYNIIFTLFLFKQTTQHIFYFYFNFLTISLLFSSILFFSSTSNKI